ncbi:MAG: hypothetical protein A3I63_01930 [Betaproteobacteria bacterium RIFCSPLOWO2_02_FULL_66_14]|nr:MAG: hypothetical protein A3I63_01930 [Betaproteobacteria bacterium RIFCSPLOWO2_02_FULL_66_14]
MNVTLELWQAILLLLAFFGCIGGFGKVLLDQFEKRLGERFDAVETSRAEGRKLWDDRFGRLESRQSSFERDLLELRADLPVEYVRREDHIRFETVINAKLDALYSEMRLMSERTLRKEQH